jgi:decaprenylphospho-beta-D-ribofuranose 2-oxidase
VIARGLGRSYGDASQCGGGIVVDLSAFNEIGPVDRDSGLIEVGAGASLQSIMAATVPEGWFVPVTPGTRQVTVGGAIASDIHGKNHHRDGSFCSHVAKMTLVTPTGTHELSEELDPELFWATAGGMGLTGITTTATVEMIPIETSYISVDEERFEDVDSLMAEMRRSDSNYHYSVAWVDCMTRRGGLGRSILTRGEHARRRDLPTAKRSEPLVAPVQARLRVPFRAPNGLLNAATISAFNELWFKKAPRKKSGAIHSLSSFFHPLDGIADWNLLYGSRGFLQYQFAVGDDHEDCVKSAIELLSSHKVPSFLAVLKRFGQGDPGPLSFPIKGWTLALDLPVGPRQLPSVLDELDSLVVGAGGRVYLAKDSRLRPDLLAAMYPRVTEFEEVCRRVDPDGLLNSDLSRRLGIRHPGATWRE